MLKNHGRYDYSAIAKRADYSWPGGERLALHFSLNVEHFEFGQGLGNDYAAPHPQPNSRSYAWRDFGNRVGAWRLLELAERYDLPYAHDLNDSIECVSRRTPAQLHCENLIDQFDAMLEESARRPLVMSIVLHSFVLGQAYRARQFGRVVEHILRRRDRVWITRPGDICAHIESLPKGIVPGS